MKTFRLLTDLAGQKKGALVDLFDDGEISEFTLRGWIEPVGDEQKAAPKKAEKSGKARR